MDTPSPSNTPSPSKRLWLYIGLGLIIVLALLIYVLRLSGAFDGGISGHGWAALIAGTSVSIILGGVLTGTLIWGRRNGYDEGAHEMHWNTSDANTDGEP